jgi:hypothetical protein
MANGWGLAAAAVGASEHGAAGGDGGGGGSGIELGGLLIPRGVLRGRRVAVVVGNRARLQTTTETRRSGRTYRGRGQQTRFAASSIEAEAQSAGPNAMPGRIESVVMVWLGNLYVAHRTGGSRLARSRARSKRQVHSQLARRST